MSRLEAKNLKYENVHNRSQGKYWEKTKTDVKTIRALGLHTQTRILVISVCFVSSPEIPLFSTNLRQRIKCDNVIWSSWQMRSTCTSKQIIQITEDNPADKQWNLPHPQPMYIYFDLSTYDMSSHYQHKISFENVGTTCQNTGLENVS